MNKLLKISLVFTLIVCALSVVPSSAIDGALNLIDYQLDKTGWSGCAADANSKEEHSRQGTDGAVNDMLNDNSNVIFHTNYSGNTATLPVYVFIDLNGLKEFKTLMWQNRQANAAKNVDIYLNATDENLIPADLNSGYKQVDERWGDSVVNVDLIQGTGNDANGYKNSYIEFSQNTQARQILIKINSCWGGGNSYGTVFTEGQTCHVTGTKFQLFKYPVEFIDRVTAGAPLDRTNWEVKSFGAGGNENYKNPGSATAGDGGPSWLIDGNYNTWWHSNYSGGNPVGTVPYYIIVDLDRNSEAKVDFNKLSWTNRGQAGGVGANGIVKKYKLYMVEGDETTTPLNDGKTQLNESWVDITDKIVGHKTDDSGTYAEFGYYRDDPASQYTTYAQLSETISASRIMIQAIETANSDSSKLFGSGVEFNLFNAAVAPSYKLNLRNMGVTASLGSDDGSEITGGNAGSAIDGNTGSYADWISKNYESNSNGSYPTYLQLDLKGSYFIDAINVDVYANRTYKDFVVAFSDTIEGFEDPNERYVVYSTDDPNNRDVPLSVDRLVTDAAQSDVVKVKVKQNISARYIRIYMNGSDANKSNHICEIDIYGRDNNAVSYKSVSSLNGEAPVIEGYYSNNSCAQPVEPNASGAFVKYVSKDFLESYAQVLKKDGKNTIRLVAGATSLNPNNVGFIVKINGEEKVVKTTKKVLTTINETIGSSTVAKKPHEAFNNGEMNYFYTLKINNVPNADKFSDTDTIEITPFWTYYSSNADSQQRLVGQSKIYKLKDLLN